MLRLKLAAAVPFALMMLGLQLQPVQFMNGGYQYGELLHGMVSEGDFPGSEDLLSGSGNRGIQASAAVGQFLPVVSRDRVLDVDSSFSAGPQLNARDRIVEAPCGHGLDSHTGDFVGSAVRETNQRSLMEIDLAQNHDPRIRMVRAGGR
jgi:hypothetical protein